MSLTDATVRNAKPVEKSVKLADGGGLYLLITPNGSKLWKMKYRFGGVEKKLSFGAYPAVSLKDARNLRDEAKTSIAKGVDPSVIARIEKACRQASGNSFKEIALEYLAKKQAEGKADATMIKKRWYVDFAIADLGSRPIAEISTAECLIPLRKIEKRGNLATAGRVRGTMGEIFRYAIATGRADNDPTVALRGALQAPKEQHHSAITDAKQFGELLRAIAAYEGRGPFVGPALRLMALLYSRPGELRMAKWCDFDLDEAVWTIPPERTKMRREHKKPLPPQAVSILRELHSLSGDGEYVFPSERSVKRPMSDMAMNTALQAIGFGKHVHVPHGFRTSASSLLNESGMWNPDAIEAELAHIGPNRIRAAYHRAGYWDERVRMAEWWGNECDRLRAYAGTIPLRR